jgi:molybdopterin-guanine dinucleotide biosynthesis protein A/molybdopterin-guanine dinucleotide biosynthesis protein
MIRIPNMLMVGAAGRNRGKTTFICRLVERISKQQPVAAIKVTAFDDVDGKIVVETQKCQTYKTLQGRFMVTRESEGPDEKDTHRMFHAGAKSVYWLRTLKSALADGMEALLEQMRADGVPIETACIICESNSARKAVEPGLFVIVRQTGDDFKPSCAEVYNEADRIIMFHGDGWDTDPSELVFSDTRWRLPEDATAILLSGGHSSRMGQDKAMLSLDGVPMIENIAGQLTGNFREVLVSGAPEKYALPAVRTISDREPGRGPLMGLLSALRASGSELNWITTCDMPEPNLAFVRKMIRTIGNYDAVVPVDSNGWKQPLIGLYRKRVVEVIEQKMAEDQWSIHGLVEVLKTEYIPLSFGWYRNLNTQEDYQEYLNHGHDSI